MKRNQKLIDAQKAYYAICEMSWKRYENNEITYGAHECTVETALKLYNETLENVGVIPHKCGGNQ